MTIHGSIRTLGLARSLAVDGGAELILDAAGAALGPGGTSMMVLRTEHPMAWF